MIIATPQPVHANVGNAPIIVGVLSSAGLASPRLFTGKGAPNTQLLAGNGKYNGAASGWVVAATLASGGAAYTPGDVLMENAGGTGTAMQITVDQTDATGLIIDWHYTRTGNYSAYPNPAGAAFSGGKGNGAQFNLIIPAPDYYVDYTTLTAPAFYLCMTAGSAGSSVWAQISGNGGGFMGEYNPNTTYAGGSIVQKSTGTNQGTWAVPPGKSAGPGTPITSVTFPIAPGSVWTCLALGIQTIGACGGGGNTPIMINGSGPF